MHSLLYLDGGLFLFEAYSDDFTIAVSVHAIDNAGTGDPDYIEIVVEGGARCEYRGDVLGDILVVAK